MRLRIATGSIGTIVMFKAFLTLFRSGVLFVQQYGSLYVPSSKLHVCKEIRVTQNHGTGYLLICACVVISLTS